MEIQRFPHVAGRSSSNTNIVPQRITDDNENAPKELASTPADCGGYFGRNRMRDLAHIFQHDRYQTETGGAENGEDRIDGCEGAGRRCPYEGEVAGASYRDEELDSEEVGVGAIDQWRGHRRCHQAYDNQ